MWSTLSAAWQTRTSRRDSRLHMLILLMYPTAASTVVRRSYVPGSKNSIRSGADSKGMSEAVLRLMKFRVNISDVAWRCEIKGKRGQ